MKICENCIFLRHITATWDQPQHETYCMEGVFDGVDDYDSLSKETDCTKFIEAPVSL